MGCAVCGRPIQSLDEDGICGECDFFTPSRSVGSGFAPRGQRGGGVPMGRYGVFRRSSKGSWWWISAADDLTEAKRKMLDFARDAGHEHFVHDFMLGQCVATSIENKADTVSTTQ